MCITTRYRTLFYILLAFASWSCKEEKDLSQSDEFIHMVKTIAIQSETVTPTIHSFGSVSYESKANLTAIVEGQLKVNAVKEGDSVRKGQLLSQLKNIQLEIQEQKAIASLKNAETQYQLALSNLLDFELKMKSRFLEVEKNSLELEQQHIELTLLEKDYEDKKRLLEAGGITKEAYERQFHSLQAAKTAYVIAQKNREILLIGLRDEDLKAHGYPIPADDNEKKSLIIELNSKTLRAQAEVAKAQVFTAEKELESIRQLVEELKIVSPINGIVGAIYLEEGERAKEGDKIITIFNANKVYAVFPIQETEIVKIREGLKAFIQIDSLGETTLEGIIEQISPMIDPQSGNLTVKALLDNPQGNIKPGMFARIDILYDKPKSMIHIPQSCLIKKEGTQGTVLAVVNNRIIIKNILLGEQHENGYYINEGLKEGDILVDSPSPVLKEGDKVETY